MRLTSTEARFLAAATLGVPTSASVDEARAAWRELVRRTHPDRGGDADRFQAVQAAWEVWQLLEPTQPAVRSYPEPAPRVIRRDRVADFDVHTQQLPDLSDRLAG